MHLCMLSATSIHADLAKRLLKFYPKLIVDIYLDEEYYGLYEFCYCLLHAQRSITFSGTQTRRERTSHRNR